MNAWLDTHPPAGPSINRKRLQEYRTALITARVTGKIDVRHEPQINTIKP